MADEKLNATQEQTTTDAPNGGQWECRFLGDDEPMVSIQITLPESMRKELFLAVQEIFNGGLERTQLLEQDRESVRAAAMRGLETLAKTLDTHKGTGQTIRIARFLGAIYNGYEYSFDLIDLRALDTELANACLAYLNYDRLGIVEVHEHLIGGGEQLNRWLAESGLTPK
jgi:hypothetical protein